LKGEKKNMAEKDQYVDKANLAILWAKIKEEDAKKQDKESGKGLSTNDYTASEKAKLANIEAGAQVNDLEGVQVNGVSVPITNKIANIPVPTNNNQLSNGAGYVTMDDVENKGYQTSSQVDNIVTGKGYQTASQVNTLIGGKGYQTAAQVQAAINASGHLKKQIVETLPTTGQSDIIYLVPKSTSDTNNVYDEYQWINNKWELMGDSQIDLTGYYNTTNLVPLTEAEIDAICV
jgi:hypothetical protein